VKAPITRAKHVRLISRSELLLALLVLSTSINAQDKPNIVFVFADNLGYGELGSYGGGILRGASTPRIDSLGSEGTRLLNFNVEPSCTPSRSALLTGRHPIRSGTYAVPIDGRPYGLVQWEITLPKLLSKQGYATALYGKWHLGDSEGRYPNDQGFDEWYGIPNSSDESIWAQQKSFDPTVAHLEYIMQGRRGEKSRKLKVYDAEARRQIDLDITAKTIDFMKNSVKAGQPFFAYVPITQVHLPTEPSKKFAGMTGHGDWADVLAQMDWCVGQLLDAVAELKIEDNTIFIFTSDNGPEDTRAWRGWAGPWSGSYNTAMEGSLRVPFLIRWPRKVPAGRVSNEMVHEVDIFTTLARITGATIPGDRAIDGLDQTAFLLGKHAQSTRDWVPAFIGTELYAVKWRNWKVHFYWQERMDDTPQRLVIPKMFDLYTNPQERVDESLETAITHGWVAHAVFRSVAQFQESLKKYPPIPMGTQDPYTTAAGR
jgi:arylsulfatase